MFKHFIRSAHARACVYNIVVMGNVYNIIPLSNNKHNTHDGAYIKHRPRQRRTRQYNSCERASPPRLGM